MLAVADSVSILLLVAKHKTVFFVRDHPVLAAIARVPHTRVLASDLPQSYVCSIRRVCAERRAVVTFRIVRNGIRENCSKIPFGVCDTAPKSEFKPQLA